MSAPTLLAPSYVAALDDRLDFALPPALAAAAPPEARGLARDAVRLLVSRATDDQIDHLRVRSLPTLLAHGDVLVVNASATLPAALPAWRAARGDAPAERVALHLSSPMPDAPEERWIVELRRPADDGSRPLLDARAGERLRLGPDAEAMLVAPFAPAGRPVPRVGGVRLWEAALTCPDGVVAHARRHGAPIRYGYARAAWPLDDYQTVFASEPGSAEMPSAGRPFTRALVRALERAGVRIAPLVLHTGVASLESDEAPYPERYRVPAETADAVNRAHDAGGRVVAVGTTVVRALETVADPDGRVHAGAGWTELVITPSRGVRAVDALLTGLHEPRSSHLAMLEALAGRARLATAYAAALRERYLWHEFGDAHLILGTTWTRRGAPRPA
jgi:S-adenosylmethionine:tRNA ribosyltransferase-isomerase